mmetsp:Transcript_16526/g.27200  ORF Transcript_16526/g.27200 Transcript_16526/m.27200 type:complete len:217 (+) Transcript_16526:78-728(+)
MTTSISSSNHQPATAVDSQQLLLLPKPTKFEVHACQFSSWYSTFRSISKSSLPNNHHSTKVRKHVTIESKIIKPLPQDFIEYLLSDGVLRLPLCAGNVSSCLKDDTPRITTEADDDEAAANEDNDDNNNNNNDDDDDDTSTSNNNNHHHHQLCRPFLKGRSSPTHSNPTLIASPPKNCVTMNVSRQTCTINSVMHPRSTVKYATTHNHSSNLVLNW